MWGKHVLAGALAGALGLAGAAALADGDHGDGMMGGGTMGGNGGGWLQGWGWGNRGMGPGMMGEGEGGGPYSWGGQEHGRGYGYGPRFDPDFGMMGPPGQGGYGPMGPGFGMMGGPGMMGGYGMMGAGPYGFGPGYGGPGMMDGHKAMMQAHHGLSGGVGMLVVDGNGDGAVSDEEASAIAERGFLRADLDGDDAVERGEYQTGGVGLPPQIAERRGARFDALDGDGDGTLIRAEFFAAMQAEYRAADSDGDGVVSAWEFRAARQPF